MAPKQKPNRSEQVVRTPPEFLAAVQERFGPIFWDLAASADNRVAARHLGPGSKTGEDALANDWAMLPMERGSIRWCNPPHGASRLWVKKASEQRESMLEPAVLLLPASVGSNWFAEHVHGRALSLAIRPRLKFVGQTAPYPKDLMICVYGRWVEPGFGLWRWKEDESPF